MKIMKFQSDVSLLKPLAEKWYKESNGDMGIKKDVDKHLKELQELIESPSSDVLVLSDGDRIFGYMGLIVFESPLGDQFIAREHYWYVEPEKRGISALKFLPMAEKWARAYGCSHLLMNASNLASKLHDRTCKIYKKFGMRKFETTYIKRIENELL